MVNELILDEEEYNYNGHKVKYIYSNKMPDESTFSNYLDKTLDVEMVVLNVFDIQSNITYEYQITQCYTKKVIYNIILSKEKDIIEKRFCNE